MPEPQAHETIDSPDGGDRLMLLYVPVAITGYPPGSAADFHSLRWEVKTTTGWECKLELGSSDLEKVLGDEAVISQLHSFDPEAGRAVVQFSTNGPKNSYGGSWCLFTWRDWDLLNNREHRFIEMAEDIFAPPKDAFAMKCEEKSKAQHIQITEQDGGS